MPLITRIVAPDNKNAKLTSIEMDNNLYYLQALGVSALTFSSNTLTITNPTGGVKTTNINNFTGLTVNGVISATTISGGTYYGDGSNLTNIVTSITATSGLSGNSITGNVTIINTSPDQVVTLSGGTGVSVTGTYPNFTIINTLPEINYTSTINLFNYYNFI